MHAVADQTGASVVVADVSEPEGVAKVVDGTIATLGRLDGLVINDGIIHVGRVDEVTPEQWDETLRVNLTSPFLLVRAALPHLIAARGAVVAVSSVAALRASDGMAAYSASKAGLLLLTQSLAVDHGRDGLRANAVCPWLDRHRRGDMEMAELGVERDSRAKTPTASPPPSYPSAGPRNRRRSPRRSPGCCPTRRRTSTGWCFRSTAARASSTPATSPSTPACPST